MKQIFNQPDMNTLAQKLLKLQKRAESRVISLTGAFAYHSLYKGDCLFCLKELEMDEFEEKTLFSLFKTLGYIKESLINGMYQVTEDFKRKVKDIQ